MVKTLKFRHQRSADNTLECFDLWILFASRDMAKSVWQEAYERASLPEPQAHVINHLLLILILQFVIEHVLFLQRLFSVTSYFGFVCQSVLPLVSCLICLKVQASLYCKVVVVVVWFILER